MNKDSTKTDPVETSSPMSVHDFTEWGVQHVAYIQPVVLEDQTVYAIFAANGQQLGMADNLDVARAAVVQNELEPISVH